MNQQQNPNLLDDFDKEVTAFMHTLAPEVEPDYDGIPMLEGVEFKEPGPGAFDVAPQQIDLFGETVEQPVQEPIVNLSSLPDIVGQDILSIRTLTGKKRDNAMAALYSATERMMADADPACFFIPGNTASSKNSKEIGFYLKKNPITKQNDRVNILTDSKVTKAYKKSTAGYWLQNKVEFLNQTRHLPLPLKIEFTFIRDSMRRFDVINACQVVADLMAENGWIPDDESVYFIPVFNTVTYFHNKLAGVLLRVIK